MPESPLTYANRAGKIRTVLSVLFVFVVLAPGPCIDALTYAQRFGSEGSFNNPNMRIIGVRSPWPGIDQEIVHTRLRMGYQIYSNWYRKSILDCRGGGGLPQETDPRSTQCINIGPVRNPNQCSDLTIPFKSKNALGQLDNKKPIFLNEPYPYLISWGPNCDEPLNVRGQCTLANGTTEPCLKAQFPYPFAFDTIIAGVNSDLTKFSSRFNEICICPHVGKWHAMINRETDTVLYPENLDPSTIQYIAYDWFRPTDTSGGPDSRWNVWDWHFLKTRNPNVKVIIRQTRIC